MRGAHRGVWCSKGQRLMEAKLFAAERCRPAPSGRALLCAAPYARKIQGNTAAYKLENARNRAPAPPFRCTSPMCQRKGGFGGVKRGQGNHTVPLPPFVSAARRRLSRPPKAAMPGLPIGSHLSPAAASRRNGGTASPRLRVKQKWPLLPEGSIFFILRRDFPPCGSPHRPR